MNKERAAMTIAVASLILGLAADLLLRWIPWGLNAALWTALFLTAAFTASRQAGRGVHPFAAAAAVLAAAGLVWRDSPVLAALDVALLVLFLPMLGLGARGVRVARAGLSQIAVAIATTGVQAVAGSPQLLFSDLKPAAIPNVQISKGAGVAVRGVAIAAPALILFGSLLASADANFAQVIRDLIVFDVGELFLHLLITAIAAGICAGFLRSFALGGTAPMPSRPSFLRLPRRRRTSRWGW